MSEAAILLQPTPAEEVGALFQSARLEKGLTVEFIASTLHIRKCYLKDMEKGYLENIPGEIYQAGFVRLYARHLGLDGDELIRRLSLDHVMSLDASPTMRDIHRLAPNASLLPSKWVIFVATGIAFFLFYYFLMQ